MATTGALLAALVLLLAVGSMLPQPVELANGATPSLPFFSTIRVFLHHRTPTHRHRRCPPHPCHRPKVDTMDVIKNDFVLVGGDVVSNMNLSQHIAAHVERTLFSPTMLTIGLRWCAVLLLCPPCLVTAVVDVAAVVRTLLVGTVVLNDTRLQF
jgi:hypothetical protein